MLRISLVRRLSYASAGGQGIIRAGIAIRGLSFVDLATEKLLQIMLS